MGRGVGCLVGGVAGRKGRPRRLMTKDAVTEGEEGRDRGRGGGRGRRGGGGGGTRTLVHRAGGIHPLLLLAPIAEPDSNHLLQNEQTIS